MQIHPYLLFNGDCAAAMAFYQRVLGGKLDILRFSEIPEGQDKIKPSNRDLVMHACLQCEEHMLMASDSCPDQPAEAMGGFSVALTYTDTAHAAHIFGELGKGGSVVMPWGPTFWAEGFGMLKDQYGVAWMINSNIEQCPTR